MNNLKDTDVYYKNLVGYQNAMKSLIEVENELINRNDPISKRKLTKVRLQKKLNKKQWNKFINGIF